MSKGIHLAGGGSAKQEAAVWDAMLDGVSRLLYWPVALSGEMLRGAEGWLCASLGDRPGLEVTTWLDLSQHHGDDLDAFDLVFIGGGNTYDLLHRLRAANLGPALTHFIRAGGAYYGGSAGAIVAGTNVGLARGLDTDRHHDTDHSGLGLVPVDVLPHFSEARIELAKTWSAGHGERPLLGIPEASGVWFSGERVVALGPDPVDIYRRGEHISRHHRGEALHVL